MNGVGVDILAMDRLRPLAGQWDDPFFNSVFTESERSYCLAQVDPLRAFAGIFASKEAVFKALSLSGDGVRLQQIEIGRSKIGQPTVTLHGLLAKRAAENGGSCVLLSLSYERDTVVAFAVSE